VREIVMHLVGLERRLHWKAFASLFTKGGKQAVGVHTLLVLIERAGVSAGTESATYEQDESCKQLS
jgi:hypothetical protein